MRFIVQGDSLESYTGQKGVQTKRRLALLGESDFAEQICQCDLPSETAEIGKGNVVELRIRGIVAIFNGKPKLDAVLVGVQKAGK
jgi:hypothetical protein